MKYTFTMKPATYKTVIWQLCRTGCRGQCVQPPPCLKLGNRGASSWNTKNAKRGWGRKFHMHGNMELSRQWEHCSQPFSPLRLSHHGQVSIKLRLTGQKHHQTLTKYDTHCTFTSGLVHKGGQSEAACSDLTRNHPEPKLSTKKTQRGGETWIKVNQGQPSSKDKSWAASWVEHQAFWVFVDGADSRRQSHGHKTEVWSRSTLKGED